MQLVSIIATGVLGNGSMFNNNSVNIVSSGDGQPDTITKAFIYVLLVIGCFQFAKKVPELIEGLFGIKMSGDLRIGQTLGTFGGATVGGALGSTFGAVGAFAASRNNELGAGKTFLNTARGFASGGITSSFSAGKAGDKGFSTWSQIGRSAAGRNSRAVDIRGTTTALGRAGARTRNALGMQAKKESLDSRLETYNSVVDNVKAMEERAKGQLAVKSNDWKLVQAQRNKLTHDYNTGSFNLADERTKVEDYYRKKNNVPMGPLTDKQQAELNAMVKDQDSIYATRLQQMSDAENKMVEEYINKKDPETGKAADADIGRMQEQVQRITDENDFTVGGKKLGSESEWSDYKEFKTEYDTKAKNLKASNEYEDAVKYDQYIKSSVGQKHMNG